jgi:hypothetical protein
MAEMRTPHSGIATSVSGPRAPGEASAERFSTLKRVAMAGITAFIAVNIWTGCPLLALWVGSQFVGHGTLSMAAVGIVVVVLAVLVFTMALLLTWLNTIYGELTGRSPVERRSPWLRSMRAEADAEISHRVGVTALERIVILNVYIAVIALLVWYVFFAGAPSPLL